MTARLAAAKMPSNFTSQSQQIDSFPSAPSHLTVDSRNHPWMEKQRPPGEKEKRKTWGKTSHTIFFFTTCGPCLPGPLYRHATDSDNFCPSDNSQSQSVSAVRSTRKTKATRFHLKIPLAVAQKLNNFFCICGVWWFLQNSAPARLQESFTTFLFPMDIIQPSWTKRFWPPFRSRSCTISCPGCEHIYWLAYQRVSKHTLALYVYYTVCIYIYIFIYIHTIYIYIHVIHTYIINIMYHILKKYVYILIF